MFSRKQYHSTLLIAIIVFVIAFLVMYFYMQQHSWQDFKGKSAEPTVKSTTVEKKEKVYIVPQTKVILKNENEKNKALSETKLNTKSLLGLTKEEVAQRFQDYTIETFSEKEVVLVKQVASEPKSEPVSKTYVLGVDEGYVCIKERGTSKRPVKIDYKVNHFSKYIYSLLLNEEIEITSAQKETLLLNPSTLQRILQGYSGE